jgi:hypothetical protein
MKTYWGVEVKLHAFLTSALDGDEWSASRPGRFTPRERVPSTHWIGGWVSHFTHTDPYPSKTQPNITQYRETCLKREVRCTKPHAQCTANVNGTVLLANIRPNLALLLRTCFRSIRRREIHRNIEVDIDALNRRRLRYYLRRNMSHLSRTVIAVSWLLRIDARQIHSEE